MQLRHLAIASLCLALACGKKADSKETPTEAPKPTESETTETAPVKTDGGSESLGMLAALFSAQMSKEGLYDAPTKSDGFDSSNPHFVVAKLSGPIVELQGMTLWGASTGTELRTITNKLTELAADEQVKGLVLRVSQPSMDFAVTEELADAFLAFKSGRKIYCHIEQAGAQTMMLLSVCDAIGLAPSGTVDVSGVIAMPLYLRGLFDKLDIYPDFLQVGAYKGAGEMYTRKEPSKAMEETINAILDTRFNTLIARIAAGRGMTEDKVKALIDTGVYFHNEAERAGIVDQTADFDAFRDKQLDGQEWTQITFGKDLQESLSGLTDLIGLGGSSRPSEPHVAVVYAVGAVVDGRGDGPLAARAEIASELTAAALRRLANEDSVKAVVLRVSSPGGSALASELIARAVETVKAKKPVIVSMGGVAASGGYYISADATRIFAQKNTLTGSIGVIAGKLAPRKALANIGITTKILKRGKHADLMFTPDPWSKEQRSKMQSSLDGVYELFTKRVAAGRKLELGRVKEIAQGRVWTGEAAKDNGLVDEIGGLSEALAHARKLTKLDADGPLEVYPPQPSLIDFVKQFGQTRAPSVSMLLEELEPALRVRVAAAISAVQSFRQAPVQTRALLPVFP